MTKKAEYVVMVVVSVETEVVINADSFEDALAKARKLGVKDLVSFDTVFMDGEVKVAGVYSNDVRAST
jgi:hypothetical protein